MTKHLTTAINNIRSGQKLRTSAGVVWFVGLGTDWLSGRIRPEVTLTRGQRVFVPAKLDFTERGN